MQPESVCQLSDREQEEIRKMLTGLLLYELNNKPENMEKIFGVSFEQVIQDGMDSKVFDVDHRTLAYLTVSMPEKYQLADKAVISDIFCKTHGWDTERLALFVAEQAEDDWER